MKLKENKLLLILIALGAILFFFVASVLLNTQKKTTAVVPIGTIEASTMITEGMVTEIEIPADTPGNYIKRKELIIGSRLKNTVAENQFLYESDFMSSWADYTEIEAVPEDYVITNIQVDAERAVGGLITAGDYVDVLLVNTKSKDGMRNADDDEDAANTWLNNTNTNANYVLANVLVLTTDSALAASQESDMSAVEGDNNKQQEDSKGNYIVALSYNDYLKFRIANSTDNSEIWLNICPSYNKEHDPLIAQMANNKFAYLHDAQKQVMDKEGNMIEGVDYYTQTDDGTLVDASSNPDINFNDGKKVNIKTNEDAEDVEDSEDGEDAEGEETKDKNADGE